MVTLSGAGPSPAQIIAAYDLGSLRSLDKVEATFNLSTEPFVEARVNVVEGGVSSLADLLSDIIDRHAGVINSMLTSDGSVSSEATPISYVGPDDIDIADLSSRLESTELGDLDPWQVAQLYQESIDTLINKLQPQHDRALILIMFEAAKWSLALLSSSRERTINMLVGKEDAAADQLFGAILGSSQKTFDTWSNAVLAAIPPRHFERLYDQLAKGGVSRLIPSSDPADVLKWMRESSIEPSLILSAIAAIAQDEEAESGAENSDSSPFTNQQPSSDSYLDGEPKLADSTDDLMSQVRQSEAIPEPIRNNVEFWLPIVQQMWDEGIRIIFVPTQGILAFEQETSLVSVAGDTKQIHVSIPYILAMFDEYLRQVSSPPA